MAEKSRLISRNPLFISALEALAFSFPLWFFLGDRSWMWAIAYLSYAFFRYSRPIFNVSAPLPLFLCVIALPLLAAPAGVFFRVALTLLVSLSFSVVLGVKNLTFTHRGVWMHCTAYTLSYVAFLAFFGGVSGMPFFASWLFTFLFIYSAFRATMPSAHLALIAAVFVGEMLWIVSWLPIGYLSSANFLLLIVLFLADAVHEGRIPLRSKLLFPVLSFVIAASSYWRL